MGSSIARYTCFGLAAPSVEQAPRPQPIPTGALTLPIKSLLTNEPAWRLLVYFIEVLTKIQHSIPIMILRKVEESLRICHGIVLTERVV
ncbi:hypothetical protein KIN20_024684 [Parelaphostrongylus tenuis]|uniref:Uncharacterized protein n=1 Tax=Parelaphostrongylus tenuis TaxID=148309 RepID=A0AAD5MTW2_PARTN|nr:hypothetical protein KIN20_024684 [Parelaphostrongylus tenuis]